MSTAKLTSARYATENSSFLVNNVSEFECHGEILEYDPPRVLVYTWIANWHDDATHRTIVRWELTPKSDGTQVKVIHSGLTTMPIARKDYSSGWPGVVDSLKKFVEALRRNLGLTAETMQHRLPRLSIKQSQGAL